MLGTVETVYKPTSPVDQIDLEFLIHGDSDTYINLDIKLYFRCKFVSGAGKDVDLTDTKAVTNNLLHSLFSRCNVTLNGTANSQSSEYYNYRSYLTPLLTYATNAAASHLPNT